MTRPIAIALDLVAEREDFYATAAADLDLPLGHEAVDALAEQRAEKAARAWLETEAYHVGEAGEDVFEALDDALTCALAWAREVNGPIEIRRAGVVVWATEAGEAIAARRDGKVARPEMAVEPARTPIDQPLADALYRKMLRDLEGPTP